MTVHAPAGRNPSPHWWQRPALVAVLAALLIVVVAFLPALWQMVRGVAAADLHAARAAPWEADVTAGGAVRALGLRIPGSTLHDAQTLWGEQLFVAVMVPRAGPPSLEATVENARPGGIQGRVLLTANPSTADLRRWMEHPAKDELVGPTTRRITLDADSLAEAMRSPVNAIGFIPATQLEDDVVRQRFGAPDEILDGTEGVKHWLYPARGLALMLDPHGRELLQFVPPAQFASRLRQPLVQALKAGGQAPAASSPQ